MGETWVVNASPVIVIGTLGIIIRAKMRGLIPSAADVVRDIRDAGLFLHDATIAVALRHIGEVWPVEL